MAPVSHVVAFKFKQEVPEADRKKLRDEMLALKTTCIREGKPYILSCKGGYQSSPEGKHHNMDIVFIVEFASEEDRDFYLDTDKIHGQFKDLAGKLVADVVVLDFSPF